jgi:hypothetical protein
MTPLWFQRALRYLRREWVTQHDLDTRTQGGPMPDHNFHWVIDRFGGSPQPCCQRHGGQMFQGSVPATERLIDQLGGDSRCYISERMGGNPRDFPGPPKHGHDVLYVGGEFRRLICTSPQAIAYHGL